MRLSPVSGSTLSMEMRSLSLSPSSPLPHSSSLPLNTTTITTTTTNKMKCHHFILKTGDSSSFLKFLFLTEYIFTNTFYLFSTKQVCLKQTKYCLNHCFLKRKIICLPHFPSFLSSPHKKRNKQTNKKHTATTATTKTPLPQIYPFLK